MIGIQMQDEPFVPGDLIRLKYRYRVGDKPNRIVIATTADPDVVTVFDPETGYKNVFTWSHELVSRGTDETIKEARERLSSGDVEKADWFCKGRYFR